jgi:PAS domain S-box-containing protein
MRKPGPHLRFSFRVVLPTVLAIGLFVVTIFFVIVPAYERQILDRKEEMLSELTQSAVSILTEYEREERAGALDRAAAQREAITRLRYLRYGEEGKDYFWVTDMHPVMVMHPYRPDLEGQDLSDFADPGGKRLFMEMARRAKTDGSGFVEYVWQWKDDPERVVPKLSHIRAFNPWGWVVGTGIYLEDVRREIDRLTGHLVRLSLGITAAMTLLLLIILQQSLSIERERSRAEGSLLESRERYRALVEASTEGIALLRYGRIAFANPTLIEILGRPEAEVLGREPSEFFEERKVDPRSALPSPEPSESDASAPAAREGWIRRPDGERREVVLTASKARIEGRGATILAVREVSPQARAQREREELAVELQVSLQFMQEPVKKFLREPLACELGDTIRRAAERMRRAEMSAILVRAGSEDFVGIITDRDLRDRVVAGGLDPSEPARCIMSAPLLSFPESGLAGEALLFMLEHRVRHLPVRDASGRIVGLLRDRELAASQRFSPASITREIREARSPEEILDLTARVPRLVTALIDTGSPPRSINRILTAVSDTTLETLVAMALKELGPPPVPFAFITLGSEGREEQTLATDQDNALVFEDPPEADREAAQAYFVRLGERVCADLDRVGYAFCEGGNMARNPRWNRPLSEWEDLYRSWIETPEPQELLAFSIFFDFRLAFGEAAITRRLRDHVDEILRRNPPFLLHMARHALEFRLPVGAFGRLVTETSSEHERTFNLKEAMAPVVHVARLYALRHGIESTNTLERLHRLHKLGVLLGSDHDEIVQAYEYLMRLRLHRQAELMREGHAPENRIPLESLTDLDRTVLKQASARISLLLKRVGFDFLGSA